MDVKPQSVAGLMPADLRAFRALIDRNHEMFLRQMLPRSEFFRIKRRRIRVLWKYVRRLSDMSEAGMASAIIAQQSSDVGLAENARELAELAWQINVDCLVAFPKLAVEYMFPSITLRIWPSRPHSR